MKEYSKINFKNLISNEYYLVPLREKDIQKIRKWRNEQIKVLRQKKVLEKKEQVEYYKKTVKKSFRDPKPNLILCSLMNNNECIGYGGLVHIDWDNKRAELSFLNNTIRSKNRKIFQKDFEEFLKLIKQIAFEQLKLNKLHTETFDIRPFVISLLENNGFEFEGRLKKHVLVNEKFVDSLIHGCIN